MAQHSNRLIHETSPYLRQHAHNPVDWYPWGEAAWERARRENKPILLSVGYSACHWCHVMERESFENAAIARLMNEHFVNIKVDREERPDVDQVYMNAVQMLTGRGGWPMTVFLTPDGKPFYGGTYFPPEDRHGVPGFPRVLLAVAQAYARKPDEIAKTVGEVMAALDRLETPPPAGHPLDTGVIVDAAARLADAYDTTFGGIGHAPKFPNTTVLELFLRVYRGGGGHRYLDMVLHTLRRMARGGVYDQLGGGFHRYSVDQRWLVPHFEKMLYDNAQLVPLYLAAYQVSGEAFFADIARETLEYIEREMRHPQGGFYSTQDADSDGVEGKFFLWDVAEVRQVLGDDAAAEIACRYWDVSEAGNFEAHNILHVTLDVEQLARLFRRDVEAIGRLLDDSRARLLAARQRRVKPHRDEKILTAWNSLTISAFAKAAEALGDERYARMAVDAIAFIEATLQRGDRLLSTYQDGTAKLNGYLDDYAFFVAALLDVFELMQERRYLERAAALADAMIQHFWDARAGGFFFTSDDHEALIVRSKPAFDGSIPSGNSVAAHDLLRLYHYTERTEYLDRAEALLRLFAGSMRQQPFGFSRMLCSLDFFVRQPREIVLVGDRDAAATTTLLRRLRQVFVPNRTLTVVDPARADTLPGLLRGKTSIDGRPTVYVCHGRTCSAPVTTWAEVRPLLDGD
ncbi:MAG: thioredoxin domain-containing protein [Candidatus Binatia bacterium]